ncbi:MAG: flagellin [Phycisphaerales bacterium]|nr:flagellin [Phycisphaerales bacterium]
MRIGSFANINFGIQTLNNNQQQVADSLERLTTGKTINRASDDPSGLISSTQHEARIYSIESQLKSFAQQSGFLGAKEGGLSIINEQFIKLNSLVVQAANTSGNSSEEQDSIKLEINSLLDSINTIASTTSYKGQQILSEYSVVALTNDHRVPSISIPADSKIEQDPSTPETLANIAELAFSNPEAAQELTEQTLDRVAGARGAIGNQLNEIESQESVLSQELISLSESLSSIQDVDFAKEAAELVRAQILEQASILAIDVNRQSAEQVLGLIKDAATVSDFK